MSVSKNPPTEQFDYLVSVLPKLHTSIVKPGTDNPPPLNPALINLYKRILTSRWNIIQTNESQLINSILDSADKINSNALGSENISKIERLQSLYSRLTKKKIPSRR